MDIGLKSSIPGSSRVSKMYPGILRGSKLFGGFGITITVLNVLVTFRFIELTEFLFYTNFFSPQS